MRARKIWPKIIEFVDFQKGLLKSKNPGKGKIGASISYDHLCLIQKDPLVPLKLQLFEDTANTLNSFFYTRLIS